METKITTVRAIPVVLWKQLKIRAIKDGHTLSEALSRAIETYLEKLDKAA